MAEEERRYDLVTAYRAQDFFSRPSSTNYSEVRKAAKKAKCWSAVREGVLDYLRTGQRPVIGSPKSKHGWPLPSPEVEPTTTKKRSGRDRFPDLTTLIDIAIVEKRVDDVVDLYQQLQKTKQWALETEKTVAQAVTDTHPDVALGIWQGIVESLIGQVKPKAYEEAARYLRRMEKVYTKNQRRADWQSLLDTLRKEHKAKRRLMEVLDTLSRKRVGRQLV
jgi:uncharacterized Zn finger protein